ncbi:GNAT family N-acetyltransferase [Chloroflexi bacterium TSY]|nr:GNAT family N-acetyltransferase [Chloroflexi bacterium TSY]
MIQIRDFQDTPQDYELLAQIINTVWGEPTHSADELREWDEERLPKFAHRRFFAAVDDRIVGYGSFEHNPKFYHPQRFWMHLDVFSDARQQGVGGQLYEHMMALLQSDYNAHEVHTITTESRADSIRFLNERGFRESTRDPKSQLNVVSFDGGRFDKPYVSITAMGIEIKVLSDLMQEDAGALYQVYELHQMLVNDVPEPAEHTRVDFDSWLEGYSSTNRGGSF